MRRFWCCSLFSFLSGVLAAQNLVPNPSFECGENQCEQDIDATLFYQQACDWTSPQDATPDIFSTLIPIGCYSAMPYTGTDSDIIVHVGSQTPRTGSRFAGIFTFSKDPYDTGYREYLQAKLTEALIPGEYYCAKMFVSRAGFTKYAAGNLGMYFGNYFQEPRRDYFWAIPNKPQVIETAVITDSNDWVEVSGQFMATDSAQYIIIGNFSYDSQTPYIDMGDEYPIRMGYIYAYYFIDDISVEHVPHTLTFQGPRSICMDSTTTLTVVETYDNISWSIISDTTTIISTGNNLKVKVSATTTFKVVASKMRVDSKRHSNSSC